MPVVTKKCYYFDEIISTFGYKLWLYDINGLEKKTECKNGGPILSLVLKFLIGNHRNLFYYPSFP
jgi:hypothetical protein